MTAKRALILLLLATALPFAGAASATARSEADALARYEQFAKPPVRDMPFWQLQSYENLGKDAVLVWTTVKDAWLIRVFEPCSDLTWSKSIGLTSNMHRVSTKFDFVLARQSRCMIKSIQPIDYPAYREAQKRERAEKSDKH